MLQGTSSNAGKSVLAAGFCRIFLEDGYRVAPFKAQNMALNSFVTVDGLEMGRAQVTQARACQIVPEVYMNPVLLKPSSGKGAQVIVMGKPAGNMESHSYHELKKRLRRVIEEAYQNLESRFDLIVIEGAGSPAEINLKKEDITNMHVARLAKSPVVIVGDIDRGGVYAHLVGTYELLDADEQEMVAGFLINKFRGDVSQLQPANEFLEQRTGRKIFGIVPYVRDLRLPDEDSVEFKTRVGKQGRFPGQRVNIALVDLPHISNFTDFDPFNADADVCLRVIDWPGDLLDADIIIIPGSKNTIYDLGYLREKGLADVLVQCSQRGVVIVGICGGYQMLGKEIQDWSGVESSGKSIAGLGLLAMTTVMEEEKQLRQVRGICKDNGLEINGYEIHHGRSDSQETPFLLNERGDVVGSRNKTGTTWGTYLHGVFDTAAFRNALLNPVRIRKGLSSRVDRETYDVDQELSRLASIVRNSVDMDAIYRLIEKRI